MLSMKSFINFKKAFTLSEVLMTLGIIGICAAVTMPNLYVDVRNAELQSKLKKEYAAIQNAVLLVAIEDSNFGNNFTAFTYKDKLKKHFNLAKDCNINCYSVNELKTIYKTFSNQVGNVNYFASGQFFLENGSLIMINNTLPNQVIISVDLNGPSKNPNIWGVDVFSFKLSEKGIPQPGGYPGTNSADPGYCSKTSDDPYNGFGCAYKALYDKSYWWKIRK